MAAAQLPSLQAGRLLRMPGDAWWSHFALRWGVLLALGVVWQLISVTVDSVFLPRMTDIVLRTYENWLSGPWQSLFLTPEVGSEIAPSVARMLAGWGIAVVAGIGLGTLIGLVREIADYVDPIVHFLRAIPPPALIPLFMVVLGIGDTMKVALIAVGVVFPILLNTIDGVRSIDRVQLDTGRVYGIGVRRRLTRVVLPSAMPKIFAGLRVSLSIALILMVISEMVAATDGIGFGILNAQRSFRVLDMWAGILVLGVLGYILNAALLKIEGRVLAWHRGARQGAP